MVLCTIRIEWWEEKQNLYTNRKAIIIMSTGTIQESSYLIQQWLRGFPTAPFSGIKLCPHVYTATKSNYLFFNYTYLQICTYRSTHILRLNSAFIIETAALTMGHFISHNLSNRNFMMRLKISLTCELWVLIKGYSIANERTLKVITTFIRSKDKWTLYAINNQWKVAYSLRILYSWSRIKSTTMKFSCKKWKKNKIKWNNGHE